MGEMWGSRIYPILSLILALSLTLTLTLTLTPSLTLTLTPTLTLALTLCLLLARGALLQDELELQILRAQLEIGRLYLLLEHRQLHLLGLGLGLRVGARVGVGLRVRARVGVGRGVGARVS